MHCINQKNISFVTYLYICKEEIYILHTYMYVQLAKRQLTAGEHTHLNPPLWNASTGSHHRWKWQLWWTLSHTISPHSPWVRSVCSSHQPSHSCKCHRHTPQPRQESVSRASSLVLKWGERAGWSALHRWGLGLSSTSGLIRSVLWTVHWLPIHSGKGCF